MHARAPSSSANLGPGFDALAVALGLYVEVTVELADRLSVAGYGEGADLPGDATHLAAKVASQVAGHDRLAITVRSEIPVGRGLGSSAALAVAAAAAAGSLAPLAVGTRWDGHPENAAASTLGGLVVATMVDGEPVAHRLPLDPHLSFVLVIPDRQLPTKQARAALPASIPHRDAGFNLGRMGLLVAGLADHRHLTRASTEDRLHQGYRTALFPEADRLLAGLVEAGALASCWSGAGPSMLGICTTGAASAVASAAVRLLAELGLPGQVRQLEPDHVGVVTAPAPAAPPDEA
jgi:homoserine kinase